MNNSLYTILAKDVLSGETISNNSFFFNHPSHKISLQIADKNYAKEFRNSVKWDFGDGTTIEAPSAEHYYKAPGHYTIKATLYTIDRTPINDKVLNLEIYVREMVPTEISFIEPDKWKEKSSAYAISKNNKLGSLLITASSNVISSPRIKATRRWLEDKNENSYFDICKERYYHLKKYYTFLEEDESLSIDGKISDIILRPVELYSPNYIPIYGRVIFQNGKIELDAYIIDNYRYSSQDLIEFKPFDLSNSILGARDKNFKIKRVKNESSLPTGCIYIGKIAKVNVWYKNDYSSATNELLFEIDKKTLQLEKEEALRESYFNIPPLGITINFKNNFNDETVIKVLTPNGLLSSADNVSSNFHISTHLIHNFYKDYKVEAYYCNFIKNDEIGVNKITYNFLKDEQEKIDSLATINNKIEIKTLEEAPYYKHYILTPRESNFELLSGDNYTLYCHGNLVSLKELTLPKEKTSKLDIDELLNTYMSHPMYENAVNLKNMLKCVFENKDSLKYIVSKGQNFINDQVNYKTCHLDKLLSILEMLNERVCQYEASAFNNVNELKELTRILSMNYSDLFGNLIIDNYDIKIFGSHRGKNVSDQLECGDIFLCNSQYEVIAIRRKNKILKLTEPSPFVIIKDDFSEKTHLGSFFEIETFEFEDFEDQDEIWKYNNKDLVSEVKYSYSLNNYSYKWGWALNLPDNFSNNISKDTIIDGFYTFYLFKPGKEKSRKYNFLDESTIPFENGEQISLENWEKDFGFTHDCIMKVLDASLNTSE